MQSVKPVGFIYINIFQGSNFSNFHALNTVFRSNHSYAEISKHVRVNASAKYSFVFVFSATNVTIDLAFSVLL